MQADEYILQKRNVYLGVYRDVVNLVCGDKTGNDKSRVMKQRGKTAKMWTDLGANPSIRPVSGSPSVTFVGRYAGGDNAEGNKNA